MTRNELGDLLIGLILAKLYQEWPRRVDLSLEDFLSDEKGLYEIDRCTDIFLDLMEWLRDEGYLRYGDVLMEGSVCNVVLTQRALSLLKGVPGSLKEESLGNKLVGQVKSAGGELKKAAISEVVRQIIDSSVKGFLS